MADSIAAQIKRIQKMSIPDLRKKYAELFGEETRSNNKDWLWKRIAYRVQEKAEGSLSERARRRAEELADEGFLRQRVAKKLAQAEPLSTRDPRLPPSGSTLMREYKGVRHEVTVLDDGFLYRGEKHSSLSALAAQITGTRWNGFRFWGLSTKGASA